MGGRSWCDHRRELLTRDLEILKDVGCIFHMDVKEYFHWI